MSKRKARIYDVANERALMACVVHYSSKVWPRVMGLLDAQDFSDVRHQQTWSAIGRMYDAQQPIDSLTIAAAGTSSMPTPDADYLQALRSDSFVIQHVEHYAQRVAQCAQVRKTRDQIVKLAESVDWSEAGADEWLQEVQSFKSAITRAQDAGIRSASDVADEILTMLTTGEVEQRLATGFRSLDLVLGGGLAAGLHLVAARPGGGKSVVLQQIALHWAMTQDLPVFFVSMEMSERDVMRRMAAQMTGADFAQVMAGRLEGNPYWDYVEAIERIKTLPLRFLYSGSTSVQRIVAEATLMARTVGVGAVVVDYIGLVQWQDSTRRIDNRREIVGEITHALTALAANLRVPVLAAVQMNRSIEARGPSEPKLSDLRECGDLEQDAYTVLFPVVPPKEAPDQTDAKFILAKHRNGELGSMRMKWEGPSVRFVDMRGSR